MGCHDGSSCSCDFMGDVVVSPQRQKNMYNSKKNKVLSVVYFTCCCKFETFFTPLLTI